MKITMLRNAAKSFGCSLNEGETGEVDDTLAEELIARKLAVAVGEPKKVKGESKPPEIKGQ